MMIALAGEQPFAQEDLRALERASLLEELLLRDENVADVLWLREEVHPFVPHAEMGNVATLPEEPLEEIEPVTLQQERDVPGEATADRRGLLERMRRDSSSCRSGHHFTPNVSVAHRDSCVSPSRV